MARPKIKDNKQVSIRMSTDVYNRLDKFSQDTGIPKTATMEKALIMFMDDYDAKMKRLADMESHKI